MTRTERTQKYLDLAKLSAELEGNQNASKNLMNAMQQNPLSPYYESAVISFNKLAEVRKELYRKEREYIMALCGYNNAQSIGYLEVLPNGKVVAHE